MTMETRSIKSVNVARPADAQCCTSRYHHLQGWSRPLLCLLLAALAWPFEVTKNVNSGAAPVERVLIFDKAGPHGHVQFSDGPECLMTFAEDGSIVSRIIGHGDIKPQVRWQVGDGRPATFDVHAYSYLVITCRLEGQIKNTREGKVSETRPDNLWLAACLFNVAGERVGGVGLADLCEDGRTPDRMTVLKIPLMLFHKAPNDTAHISGIGFSWGKTHDYTNRDFRLVIDRVSLAD